MSDRLMICGECGETFSESELLNSEYAGTLCPYCTSDGPFEDIPGLSDVEAD